MRLAQSATADARKHLPVWHLPCLTGPVPFYRLRPYSCVPKHPGSGAGGRRLCTLTSGPLSDWYVRNMIKRLAAKAGIEEGVPPARPPPHAAELVDEGVPVNAIQLLVTFDTSQMAPLNKAMRYARLSLTSGGRSSASNIDRPITMLVHSAVQTDVMSPHCRLPSRWRSTWR